uniref:Trichodiene oxygenase n=1 Tax=Fusarium oxysporum (strain Fo5176) TaxID=660025 RepID=A0A0D2YE54_FUSOF
MENLQLNARTLLTVAASLIALRITYTVVYRLYLSPLAKIPGPRLAALTFFYEFYYDVVKRGKFLWKIQELHRQYGPIVRINPYEVHINDDSFYDEIYASGPHHPRNKIRFMSTHDESMFDSYAAETHRVRRAALSGSFSKQSIRALEPQILQTIHQLAGRMSSLRESGEVVNFKALYSGLTMDVIAQYCFGESMDNMKQDQFGKELLDFFHEMPQAHPIGRMFPWLFDIIQKIPISYLAKLDPKLQPLADYDKKISGQISDVLAKEKKDGIRTVFHEMRDSKQLPEADKTLERFKSEAAIFLGAGTETTAAALTTLSFHLTENPDMLTTLRKELETVTADASSPITVAKLEPLPYLLYKKVSGSHSVFLGAYLGMHQRKILFMPDTNCLEEGSRQCIGMNLAYAELYLTVATIFSRFDLELVGTTKRDVEIAHDFFVARLCELDESVQGFSKTLKVTLYTSSGRPLGLGSLKTASGSTKS